MFKIEPSWTEILEEEFRSDYLKQLEITLENLYQTEQIYPPPEQIFNAFNLCPFSEVRVVILGQDPYHGKNQAHGLAFSVPDGVPIPPSLKNIYKELENDLRIKPPASGNLERWARQGVLLLNATLTVQENTPGSHQNLGWETFTAAVIRLLADKKEHVVFILWGKYAQTKASLIDSNKHLILKSPHPSPLSAYTGFFGSRPFSKTNAYLIKNNQKPIEW